MINHKYTLSRVGVQEKDVRSVMKRKEKRERERDVQAGWGKTNQTERWR